MNKSTVLAFIDAEIARLQQARTLLSSDNGQRNGLSSIGGTGRKRRRMSAEARRRISEAQKKRWAARKKTQRARG
jgi:hypothetical protein